MAQINRSPLLSLFCIILFSYSVHAQWVTEQFTTEDGLPSVEINHMMQDSDGFIWIATNSGLAQFDGREFTTYSQETDSAFQTSTITFSMEDSNKRLWIATWGEGVMIRENGTFRRFKYGNDELNGYVKAITEGHDGSIWIATDGGGVYRFSADTLKQYTREDGAGIIHSTTIMSTTDGRVIAGGFDSGLDVFDETGVRNYPLPKIKSRDMVTSIYEDEEGVLWVTTSQGLYTFADDTLTEIPITLDWYYYNVLLDIVHIDQQRYLIFTTEEILTYNRETKKFENFEEVGKGYFASTLKDNECNIWLSLFGNNLTKLSRRTISEKVIRVNGEIPVINSINLDSEDRIWLSTNLGLLLYNNGLTTVIDEDDGLDENNLTGTLGLRSGELLLLYDVKNPQTYDGQAFRDFFPEAFTRGNNIAPLEASDGSIWLNKNGIGILQIKDSTVIVYGEADNAPTGRVIDMVEDKEGSIWISTDYGLRKFDGDSIVSITSDDGLKADIFTDLYVDKEGYVWIGSADGRLHVYDGTKFREFTPETGLHFQDIRSIQEDELGYMWLATSKLIMRAKSDELVKRLNDNQPIESLEVFSESDGIPPVTIRSNRSKNSVYSPKTNELWYSTSNGLLRIDTEVIIKNNREVNSFIKEVRLDNIPSSTVEEVIVPADNKFIELDYTGVGFTAPEAFTYQYRLLPYQNDWTEAGSRRTAYYSNLSPGDYTFEVFTTNEDGVEGPVKQASIIVQPAFYETAGFRVLMLFIVASIVYAVYAYRVSQIRKTEKLRLQIAGDLHDEIGGNLGTIILRSQMIGRKEQLSEKARKDLNMITNISNETAQAMRDIVWLINPENDKLDNLILKLRNTARELLEGIELDFHAEDETRSWPLTPGQRKQVVLFFKEAINNIRKHANATKVSIHVRTERNRLLLHIADNGVGFDPESNENDGMGIRSMKKRGADSGGSFQIHSSPGEGTTLTFTI